MVGGSVHLREDGGATVNQVQVAATRNQVSGNFQASKTRRGCSFGTVHCADVATLPALCSTLAASSAKTLFCQNI
jgi:hypothetical protein